MVKLNNGDPALDFIAHDVTGRQIRLSDYRGKKILLSFFRYATCPFCTVRFVRLAHEVERYARSGLLIIGVFESSQEYIMNYIGKRGLPFIVVPDPDGKLYEQYGVKKSMSGLMFGMFRMPTLLRALFDPNYHMAKPDGALTRIPADFLIDTDMRISANYYGSDIGDHIPFKTIDDFVARDIRSYA